MIKWLPLICVTTLWADVIDRQHTTRNSPKIVFLVEVQPLKAGCLLRVRAKESAQQIWQKKFEFSFVNPFISDEGRTIVLIADSDRPGGIVFDKNGRKIREFKATDFLKDRSEDFFGSTSRTMWYSAVRQKTEYLEIDVIINGPSMWQSAEPLKSMQTRTVRIPWSSISADAIHE